MNRYKHYIGIDISKQNFTVCVMDEAKNILVHKRLPQNRNGYEQLLQILTPLNQSTTIIGIESTGIYHVPVLNFLSNHGFKTVAINPCLIEKFSKLNLRPTKTDKKVASIIALIANSISSFLRESSKSLKSYCLLNMKVNPTMCLIFSV